MMAYDIVQSGSPDVRLIIQTVDVCKLSLANDRLVEGLDWTLHAQHITNAVCHLALPPSSTNETVVVAAAAAAGTDAESRHRATDRRTDGRTHAH